jgi:hypothetical protein
MGANPPLEQSNGPSDSPAVFDRLFDWAVGALLGIAGLLSALVGWSLYYVIDRATVADLIAAGEFRSDVLTESQAVDLLWALSQWVGLGLVALGALGVVVGAAVVLAHGRAREDGRPTPRWILGVVGAMVGTLLGFVPLSPALGGAVAGYLDPDPATSGLGVGILAGLFAALPAFVLTLFLGVGLVTGLPAGLVPAATVVLAVAVLFSLVYLVGLSALGGYLGRWVRDN